MTLTRDVTTIAINLGCATRRSLPPVTDSFQVPQKLWWSVFSGPRRLRLGTILVLDLAWGVIADFVLDPTPALVDLGVGELHQMAGVGDLVGPGAGPCQRPGGRDQRGRGWPRPR